MAKLRKTLGRIDEPNVVALMRLIETQSVQTLAGWACEYAKQRYLPLLQKSQMDSSIQEQALAAVEDYLRGQLSLAKIKPQLKAASQAAAAIKDQPMEQAAARAIAVACAVAQTPTNALGFLFYGAAAAAHGGEHRGEAPEALVQVDVHALVDAEGAHAAHLGLAQKQGSYDQAATQELAEALQSLQECAVKHEENPVKIDWNC